MECHRTDAELLLFAFRRFLYTAVFLPVQRQQHLFDQIIDVEELQFRTPVIYLNRKIIGNIITECSHRRIIVRTAPFAEQIRETIDQHFRPRLLTVLPEQFLARQLALPVLAAGIAPFKARLNTAGEHDRRFIPVLLQRIQKKRPESKVALHELFRIFRPVHPGEIEHKIRITAVCIQLLRRGINIVFVNNKIRRLFKAVDRVNAILAVTYVSQRLYKILSYEAFRSGN